MMMLARNASVMFCHSRIRNLAQPVGRADIVIAAGAKPALVQGEWTKPGCVVIDACNHTATSATPTSPRPGSARLIIRVPRRTSPVTIDVQLDLTAARTRSRRPYGWQTDPQDHRHRSTNLG
jgi:methylenetetrahydrofolate dehydrogenase (NADP+)/methenyltetrahydrofolate cyclohydrolase